MSASMTRRRALGAGLAAVLAGEGLAAPSPVANALQRPALPVRRPQGAVLQAIALAGERWVVAGERGVIAWSDDAGRQWQQAPSPVSVTLTALRFADARHGVAVGHGGTVLSTEDAGASWTRRLDGHSLAELMAQEAKASGDPAALREAEHLIADGPDKPWLDVLVSGDGRWLVVGAYGLVLCSEDRGRTWRSWTHRLDNPRALHLYAVRQRGATVLVAGEQGLLLRSHDAGLHFERLPSPYAGSWFTAELLPGGGMLLAGMRGNAWYSPDGGPDWRALKAPPVTFTASALDAQGRVLLANQGGAVLRLESDALVPLATARAPGPVNGLAVLGGGRVLTVGMQGVAAPAPLAEGRRS